MVFFKSNNIISSLGFNTDENFKAMLRGEVGIKSVDDRRYYPNVFQASIIDEGKIDYEFAQVALRYSNKKKYTKLEKLLILSVDDALLKTDIDITSKKTGIIISTTKGNIDLLNDEMANKFEQQRHLLWKFAKVIGDFFGNPNSVITISNACISGVLATNTAAMYINAGLFDNVIVAGGDIVSRFVVSGFMSFLSLSAAPCKPFDKNRDGLSLGEAAGTVILSKYPTENQQNIKFNGGATANDANHISGPSRTGEGMFIAIKKAMDEAEVLPNDIDHISAHGTATLYNDEMESIVVDRHSMLRVPVNSIKGYLGHTLGAAGLIETAILLEEMKLNTMVGTAGFNKLGVSKQLNVNSKASKNEIATCLKMASGFGGSNAAMIISKVR